MVGGRGVIFGDHVERLDPAMTTDNSHTSNAESTESPPVTAIGKGRATHLPLTRRTTLGGFLGLVGLNVLSGSATAQRAKGWNRNQDAQGHKLFNLGELEMIDDPVIEATDGSPLEVRLTSGRAFRFDPTGPDSAANLVGGHPTNNVDANVVGATIAGGGFDNGSNVFPNVVGGDFGTVGGGFNNTSGTRATVGGGSGNTASHPNATVSGGSSNTASRGQTTIGGGGGNMASGFRATVGGGVVNTASGVNTTVSGGILNGASGDISTIGGGDRNNASGEESTVGGGRENETSGGQATVGGGIRNDATDFYSTVGGGNENVASDAGSTVGGGIVNEASGSSSTVGGGGGNVASGRQTTVAGGEQNEASGDRATVPGGSQNVASGDFSFAAGSSAVTEDSDGNIHDGAVVFADSTPFVFRSQGPNTFTSQMPMFAPAFNTTSARAKKEAIEPVDPGAVLDAVTDLTVSTWEFKHDSDGRHMGPMAEDFHEVFGLGENDGHIATVDVDGVVLAAIQGLSEQLDRKDDRISDLEEAHTDLKEENAELRERLAALEDNVGVTPTAADGGATETED